MAAVDRDNELAALMANARYQMLARRSQYLRANPPHAEASYYPYKCGISEMIFPMTKGFMIKPQCRMGNLAPKNAKSQTAARWRSDSMDTMTGADAKFPDDLIVWLPYDPQAGTAQKLPHVGVLVEEVKHDIGIHTDKFRRAESQILRYIRRLNDGRVGNDLTNPQAKKAKRRVPGLLVLGTRCIRYEVVETDGGYCVEPVGDDLVPDSELYYGVYPLSQPDDKILLNWLLDIRDHFVQFNAPGELMPGLLDTVIAEYVSEPPVYESSLHGALFAMLHAGARLLVQPGEKDDWFLVKPQGPLRRKVTGKPGPGVIKARQRITSYGNAKVANSVGFIDFILVWFKPPASSNENIDDTPGLVIEAKRENTEDSQKKVFAQLTTRMENFKIYNHLVNGMAVLANRLWMVTWENGNPKCPNWANSILLSDWRTVKDVFNLSRPDWTR